MVTGYVHILPKCTARPHYHSYEEELKLTDAVRLAYINMLVPKFGQFPTWGPLRTLARDVAEVRCILEITCVHATLASHFFNWQEISCRNSMC